MHAQSEMYFLPEIERSFLDKTLLPLKRKYPDLGVLAIVPEAEKDRVHVIQAFCKNHDIKLCGAIFPLLIQDDQFCENGVLVIVFKNMPYFVLEDDLPEDPVLLEEKIGKVSEKISDQIDNLNESYALYMIFDAMLLNIGSILDLLYLNLANSVHYAGANAGSESFKPMPCLFDKDRLLSNSVLLLLLGNDNRGAVLEHGYHIPERKVYATSTDRNRISQIDWRPAFEVYKEFVYSQYGIEMNKENFYEYSVRFPFGLIRANQQVLVRIPVTLEEDGTIFCIGEIPDNSVLTLLKIPSVDSNHTMKVLSDGLKSMYDETDGKDLLLFYCAARRLFLGPDAAISELKEFKKITNANIVAGALSLGEIGSSTLNEYPLFHHATLVAARV